MSGVGVKKSWGSGRQEQEQSSRKKGEGRYGVWKEKEVRKRGAQRRVARLEASRRDGERVGERK